MSTTVAPPFTVFQGSNSVPTQSPGGGGGGSGGGGGQQGTSSSTSLANSASLYLYTFLATLVLLLCVSGAIVIRSFILRRRHRRMVEEAIRNGTYVAPTNPSRPSRVDLSQKPELWEVHLGGDGGWQQLGSGKELDHWNSRDWESIKPLSAYYAAPLCSYSGSTPNPTTSLPPPVYIPAPTSINPSAPIIRGNDEENQRTGTTPSLLTRARLFSLFPTSTLPSSSTTADNETNVPSNSNDISMTELSSNSSTSVKVAVLIAMPSSSSSSSHGSSSISSQAHSHPLESSSPSSPTTLKDKHDEEHLLPHLEMGIADVVIGRSENLSTSDSADTRKDGKTIYSRRSIYTES